MKALHTVTDQTSSSGSPSIHCFLNTLKSSWSTGYQRYSRRSWYWIWGFILLILLLDLVWMTMIPMSRAPDEEVRIILSDYIAAHGSLPNAWDESVRITKTGWGFSYALRPMLINILGGLMIQFVSLFTNDIWIQVLSVRLLSALSCTMMVYFIFRLAEALGWKLYWAFAAAAISALMPQVTFLSGYNNNDVFSAACVTMVLFCWVRGMRQNWQWGDCLRLALGLGLTILSYYNAYPYVLFSIPLFFLTAFKKGMSREEKLLVWKKAGFITLITFLIAGWWFIRNGILYHGDILGSKTRLEMGELFAEADKKPSTVFKPIREGVSLFGVWSLTNGDPFPWATKSFMSTIGLLGMMDYLLPGELYNFAKAVFKAGFFLFLIQYVIRLIRLCLLRFSKGKENRLVLFWGFALICAVLVVLLSLYYSWTDDFQPQGRYFMPAYTTFIFCMIQGFRGIFWLISKIRPMESITPVLEMIFCGWLTVSICGMQIYVLNRVYPYYHGQFERITDTYIEHRSMYGPQGTYTHRLDPGSAID